MLVHEVIDGRFEVEFLAGAGGMGSVYRALDRSTGAPVALKVLQDYGSDEAARFDNEVRVLAGLLHPGIVRYIAHGALPDGLPYLVMEWLEGEDLSARLTRGGLGLAESVMLVRSAAEALAVAHGQGVVHRDLKPSNLMLIHDTPGTVKLVDFGIARAGRASVALTRTGMLLGTPGYMSPEQARGEREIDASADVFALGAVLFECLTGRQAFLGNHIMALLAKLLLDEPPRVDELRPDVPAPLADLVARMLSKAREERPRDATAVIAEIDRLGELHGERAPTGAPRPAVLTGSEQQLLCVIVAAGEEIAAETIPSADTLSSGSQTETGKHLQSVLLPLGARVEVLACGGFLVTLEGADGVSDQAARAARCALAVRQMLPLLSMALVTARGEVGGRIPVGQVLDRAGKLLTARPTSGMGVRVDEVTRGLLDVRFSLSEGEAGWELLGERELDEETRTLLGRPTPCVGRDRELRMLLDLVEESVGDGVARAVLVTAPAGTGKSRLRHEFLQRVRGQHPGISIWQGRSDAMSAGSAFALLGSALCHMAGVVRGEPLSVRQDKLRVRTGRHVKPKDQARVAAFLGEVAGTPFPDEDNPTLRAARQNSGAMADQIRQAFQDFANAETAVQPVLLVLEDIHWGDLPSVKLIDGVLRGLAERPFMVFAVARPEVHDAFPRLWIERGVQEIRLGELGRRAAEALVRNALGSGADPKQVMALVERAAGHAFYLEELIRAVAEGRGHALPETVLGMVEARLLGLEPQARRVLRAASVFGGAFWGRGVTALLGDGGNTRVKSVLGALVDQEVIQRRAESRFPAEEEFTFRHALLREGAYAMLSDGDRLLGHKLAAGWLEQVGEDDAMVLAEHFERGGASERAGDYYAKAAVQAFRASDSDAAIVRANKALEGGVPDDVRLRALSLLCEVHGFRNAHSIAMPHAEQALKLAERGSAPWAVAMMVKQGNAIATGDVDALMAIIDEVRSAGAAPEAVGAVAFAIGAASFWLNLLGRFDLSADVIRQLRNVVEPVAHREPVAAAWMNLVRSYACFWATDDPWTGLHTGEQAYACFQQVGLPGTAASQALTGIHAFLLGMTDRAERELRATMTAEDMTGTLSWPRTFYFILILLERGEFEEARRLALAQIEGAPALGTTAEGYGHWGLACVLLRMGDHEAAERAALVALDKLAKVPLDHMAVSATLAAIRLAAGRAAEALAGAEGVMSTLASWNGAGFRVAYARLVHAEALDAAGEHEKAREAIAEARARLLAAAERIEAPEARASFLEGVPENARTLMLARAWLG